MVLSENHNCQIALESCCIRDKKVDIARRISKFKLKNSDKIRNTKKQDVI